MRVTAYRGKMHGRKSVQGLAMARREFGELTGGELTRFDCSTDTIQLIFPFFQTNITSQMRPSGDKGFHQAEDDVRN